MAQTEDQSEANWDLQTIWDNWAVEGGRGPCAGCPAHWSNRADLNDSLSSTSSSEGTHPFYGYGDIQDVDVVIMGEEPGKPKSDRSRTNYVGQSFHSVRNEDVTDVPIGAGSIEDSRLLFDVIAENFNTYWTQAKKCNEIDNDEQNSIAEDHCIGKNGCSGYLRTEMETVDPQYVVTIGKDTHRHLSSVFDIESLGNEAWSREIASGDSQAGIRTLDVYDGSFIHVPLAHPSYGIPSYTKKQLNLENEDRLTLTEQYYKYAGEDLVEIAQAN